MQWYYHDGSQQVGPIDQESMITLIQQGTVKSSTSVWADGMADWQLVGQTELVSFLQRNAPPPFTGSTTPPLNHPINTGDGVSSTSFRRDPNKVYPSNPPKSPDLFLLGLFVLGLPQMLFGQVTKGVCILFCVPIAVLLIFGVLTSSMGDFGNFLAVVLSIVIQFQLLRDAYKVGKVLKSGRPVGKWDFFPN